MRELSFNTNKLKTIRRKLRKQNTSIEQLVWQYLRGRRLKGYRFVRQFSIGNYVVDFYCPDKKLAVEFDGSQHGEVDNAIYDKRRTEFLSSKNIKVIRFWNNQVIEQFGDVMEKIVRELESS